MVDKKNLLSSLKKDRDKLNINTEIYNAIYKDCISSITNLNNLGILQTYFTIPMFLPGYPLYDITTIQEKIFKKLKREGLQVKKINNDTLFISW